MDDSGAVGIRGALHRRHQRDCRSREVHLRDWGLALTMNCKNCFQAATLGLSLLLPLAMQAADSPQNREFATPNAHTQTLLEPGMIMASVRS